MLSVICIWNEIMTSSHGDNIIDFLDVVLLNSLTLRAWYYSTLCFSGIILLGIEQKGKKNLLKDIYVTISPILKDFNNRLSNFLKLNLLKYAFIYMQCYQEQNNQTSVHVDLKLIHRCFLIKTNILVLPSENHFQIYQ